MLALNSLVESILAFPRETLTPADLGSILERNETTIQQACKHGQIEAQSTCARGSGHNRRWLITKAAALRYLWESTQGDKTLLRASLEQHAPALLRLLDPKPAEPPANILPAREAKARPANVIVAHSEFAFVADLKPAATA